MHKNYPSGSIVGCYSICPRGSIQILAQLECKDCRYLGKVWFNGYCISPPCPQYYVEHPVYHDCVRCYDNCITCASDLKTSCLSCKSGFFLQISGPSSECVNYCSAGFYTDAEVASCVACSSNCNSCT
jgi:hypothetical protein